MKREEIMGHGFEIGEELQGTCSGWHAVNGVGSIDVPDHPPITVRLAALENTRTLRHGDLLKFTVAADEGRPGFVAAHVRLMARTNTMNEKRLSLGASGVAECIAWDDDRGFGFLAVAGGAPKLFVHAANIADVQALRIGDRVRFVVGEDRNGRLSAIQVSLIERADAQAWRPNLTTRNERTV